MNHVNAVVVGAGVIGLAVAARLSRYVPSVLLVEKNHSYGEETSSRNSEVIHAGIYYPQGSVKATLCVAGNAELYAYCQQRHIPHRRLGKLIVAQNAEEESYLQKLLESARDNDVKDLEWLNRKQLFSIEPHVSATAALLSPSTGILDVHSYMKSLLAEMESNGGQLVAQSEVTRVEVQNKGFTVSVNSQGEELNLTSDYVINCAGLHASHVAAHIDGLSKKLIPTLHWCRGHYFSYSGKSPFNHLIYPVPEKSNVGLGIHATLDMAGQLKFGPDVEYVDELTYEVSPALKSVFVSAIQRYFAQLNPDKLHPAYSGIRPKLQASGEAAQDFWIQGETIHGIQGLVNLYGIESPGVTASLAIARNVALSLGLEYG